MGSVKLIPAAVGSVKDDAMSSYYFDETIYETNGSIKAFLIQLIVKEKNKENPNLEYIEQLRSEFAEYPKYPSQLENDEPFENREEADKFLAPLLKREKELFELID